MPEGAADREGTARLPLPDPAPPPPPPPPPRFLFPVSADSVLLKEVEEAEVKEFFSVDDWESGIISSRICLEEEIINGWID